MVSLLGPNNRYISVTYPLLGLTEYPLHSRYISVTYPLLKSNIRYISVTYLLLEPNISVTYP
jgi:hypothetical protein